MQYCAGHWAYKYPVNRLLDLLIFCFSRCMCPLWSSKPQHLFFEVAGINYRNNRQIPPKFSNVEVLHSCRWYSVYNILSYTVFTPQFLTRAYFEPLSLAKMTL